MTKTDLEIWASDIFWPRYRNMMKIPFVTNWTGGAKGACIKAILTLNPSEDIRNQILDALQAQTLYRHKLYDQHGRSAQTYDKAAKTIVICHNREGRTWIVQRAWLDEIPSLMDGPKAQGDKAAFTCVLCSGVQSHSAAA